MELESEQQRHAETAKAMRRQERRLKELSGQMDEDRTAHERMHDVIDKLHQKLKNYKKQIDDTVSGHLGWYSGQWRIQDFEKGDADASPFLLPVPFPLPLLILSHSHPSLFPFRSPPPPPKREGARGPHPFPTSLPPHSPAFSQGSAGGAPSRSGSGGVTPGNFLKFYVRFGAFWRQFFCS
jgi:uncharacterized coiled-coil protein SlyX